MATEQLVTLSVDDEFNFVGKVDYVDLNEGRLVDWKGVADISKFADKKSISYQTELYAIAMESALGVKIKEIEYRLVERPGISFCGKDNGDPEHYLKRCRLWLREAGKVKEVVVPVNESSLTAARRYLNRTSQRLQWNRAANSWIPNENACGDYMRTCEYLPLCNAAKMGADIGSIIDKDYVKREIRHPELGLNSMDIITYSLAALLFNCETKCYWTYEHQIESKKEGPSEPMRIGEAHHLGMDVLASGGLEAAKAAVADWGQKQKILGQDMKHKRDEMVAKATAMVYAGAEKWCGLETEEIVLPSPVKKKRAAKKKKGTT